MTVGSTTIPPTPPTPATPVVPRGLVIGAGNPPPASPAPVISPTPELTDMLQKNQRLVDIRERLHNLEKDPDTNPYKKDIERFQELKGAADAGATELRQAFDAMVGDPSSDPVRKGTGRALRESELDFRLDRRDHLQRRKSLPPEDVADQRPERDSALQDLYADHYDNVAKYNEAEKKLSAAIRTLQGTGGGERGLVTELSDRLTALQVERVYVQQAIDGARITVKDEKGERHEDLQSQDVAQLNELKGVLDARIQELEGLGLKGGEDAHKINIQLKKVEVEKGLFGGVGANAVVSGAGIWTAIRMLPSLVAQAGKAETAQAAACLRGSLKVASVSDQTVQVDNYAQCIQEMNTAVEAAARGYMDERDPKLEEVDGDLEESLLNKLFEQNARQSAGRAEKGNAFLWGAYSLTDSEQRNNVRIRHNFFGGERTLTPKDAVAIVAGAIALAKKNGGKAPFKITTTDIKDPISLQLLAAASKGLGVRFDWAECKVTKQPLHKVGTGADAVYETEPLNRHYNYNDKKYVRAQKEADEKIAVLAGGRPDSNDPKIMRAFRCALLRNIGPPSLSEREIAEFNRVRDEPKASLDSVDKAKTGVEYGSDDKGSPATELTDKDDTRLPATAETPEVADDTVVDSEQIKLTAGKHAELGTTVPPRPDDAMAMVAGRKRPGTPPVVVDLAPGGLPPTAAGVAQKKNKT